MDIFIDKVFQSKKGIKNLITMDRNIIETEIRDSYSLKPYRYLIEIYQKYDFYKYIIKKEFLDAFSKIEEVNSAVVFPTRIKGILQKRRYQWPTTQKIPFLKLFASSCLSKKIHQKILLYLSQSEKDIYGLLLWDSKIGILFFQTITYTQWCIRMIYLINCQVDNTFSQNLKRLKVDNITILSLSNNPIANKGITSLLKLNLGSLKTLILQDNMTSQDIIKVFKKSIAFFQKFEFSGEQIDPFQVYQEAFKFITTKKEPVHLQISNKLKKHHFLSLNQISKMESKQRKPTLFLWFNDIYSMKNQLFINIQMRYLFNNIFKLVLTK